METFEEKLAALDCPLTVKELAGYPRRGAVHSSRLDQAAASPGVPHRQFLEV